MQLFGNPGSPFVRKVLVVAAEKGIGVEILPANPRAPSPEFLAASPFRKIPALKDGDFFLADSTAIAMYFDALRPEPSVLPSDPRARGKAVWFEEVADTVMSGPAAKIAFNRFVAPKLLNVPGDEQAAQQGERELAPILDYLESQAPTDGWLAGDSFSIGDIAIASCLATLRYVSVGPHEAGHPRLAAWLERVMARPAWQEVAERERAMMGGRRTPDVAGAWRSAGNRHAPDRIFAATKRHSPA